MILKADTFPVLSEPIGHPWINKLNSNRVLYVWRYDELSWGIRQDSGRKTAPLKPGG